jgi:hypothetical protein
MGEIIQRPWKKRISLQIIEHELLIVAQYPQQELSPGDRSRWPVAKLIARPASMDEPHRRSREAPMLAQLQRKVPV